ncbi:transposable element tcb1 transposase [Trichonephila clavipes]|nr:transposable element tcb1 transposase [Trichonephila clavipes]
MAIVFQEFQRASKIVVSINTIHKETHLLGSQGCVAAHKPLITKSNHTAYLSWCKSLRNLAVEQWKQVLWRDESRFTLSTSWMVESGFGICQENALCQNALCLQ